ncbi:MAG: type IV pilus assembly protein PilM, partial [Gaiellaceae bacterium]
MERVPWWKREVGKPRLRKQENDVEQLVREAAASVAGSIAQEITPDSPVAALYEAAVGPDVAAYPGAAPAEHAGEAQWVSPAAEEAESWLAAPELPPEPQVEAAAAASEPVLEAVPAPEPVASAAPEPVAVPAPAPASLPEPAPLPEPVLVHPPVPEAELPAPAAQPAAEPVPFWKKELSFSRKPKAPKQPKQEKPRKQKREHAPKPPKAGGALRKPLRLPRPSLSFAGGGHGSSIVGLTVGASQVAAARVSNDGGAHLQQTARAPLPAGVVVGGELRDPDALAAVLSSFFAKNRLPRKHVRLGIASPRIGVRIFELSDISDERQLANAVRFRAQDALPIPAEEAVLDYRVLGESVDDEGNSVKRVLLVVAHRDLVERYIGACRKAGLTLTGIDLEAFALLRSLAPPSERDGSALVAVAIGHERTTLAVSDGRACEFTRVLEWGGWALNVALARALNLAPSEVEGLKRQLSLDGGPLPEGIAPEQAQQALDAVRRGVESLARELVSSLQYYQGQPGSLGIGEVMLAGWTAHLVGLAEELERLL